MSLQHEGGQAWGLGEGRAGGTDAEDGGQG